MKSSAVRRSCSLLLAFALISAVLPASGATIRRIQLDEVRDQSVSVFWGEIVAHSTRLNAQGNMVWTDYEISVSEHLGGTDPGERTVVSFAGGAAEGMVIHIPGVPQLEVGQTWVFFLQEGTRKVAATVGWGQGLFRISRVSLEGRTLDLLVSWDGEALEMTPDGRIARGPLVRIDDGALHESPLGHMPDSTRMPEPVFTSSTGKVLPRIPVAEPEAVPLAQRQFATLDDLRLFVSGKIEPAGGAR